MGTGSPIPSIEGTPCPCAQLPSAFLVLTMVIVSALLEIPLGTSGIIVTSVVTSSTATFIVTALTMISDVNCIMHQTDVLAEKYLVCSEKKQFCRKDEESLSCFLTAATFELQKWPVANSWPLSAILSRTHIRKVLPRVWCLSFKQSDLALPPFRRPNKTT
jgi:hypothetical protein